ncbi:hypothetical protein BGX30_005851 [Mortierella sp. GBA39]|nr:hypothetical protein BGX30_005851 [Mortierella sp. GBA39]
MHDLLVLLPLLDVVDLILLDLSRGSPTGLVDSFSKIAGRNRFKQFTFSELKHNIMKQKEMIVLLRAECLQGLECLMLKCHPAWVFLDFAPGNVSPHPFTSLSTLEHLEFLKPNFSKPMSEESAIKFNAMLKSKPRLNYLVVRTPLLGFEAFDDKLEEIEENILNRVSPWLEKLTISMYSEETRDPSHEAPLERLQEWGDAATKERHASDGVQVSVVF